MWTGRWLESPLLPGSIHKGPIPARLQESAVYFTSACPIKCYQSNTYVIKSTKETLVHVHMMTNLLNHVWKKLTLISTPAQIQFQSFLVESSQPMRPISLAGLAPLKTLQIMALRRDDEHDGNPGYSSTNQFHLLSVLCPVTLSLFLFWVFLASWMYISLYKHDLMEKGLNLSMPECNNNAWIKKFRLLNITLKALFFCIAFSFCIWIKIFSFYCAVVLHCLCSLSFHSHFICFV